MNRMRLAAVAGTAKAGRLLTSGLSDPNRADE
jgi:hypothetical protein